MHMICNYLGSSPEAGRCVVMMEYKTIKKRAEEILEELRPHCLRAEIAGSIRRKKDFPNDIEIVAIPKPYGVDLFESGIAKIVNKWEKIKGELPCKYTQRRVGDGLNLDLFFATEENWGLIFAIRTGSAEFSHKTLACRWNALGYKSRGGMLYSPDNNPIPIRSEKELFSLLGIGYIEPEDREVPLCNKA